MLILCPCLFVCVFKCGCVTPLCLCLSVVVDAIHVWVCDLFCLCVVVRFVLAVLSCLLYSCIISCVRWVLCVFVCVVGDVLFFFGPLSLFIVVLLLCL